MESNSSSPHAKRSRARRERRKPVSTFTDREGFKPVVMIHPARYVYRNKGSGVGQRIDIFDSYPFFGRVLAIDGVIQTTEHDEFVYHEMIAHVPLIVHGRAQRVLIVGGGDGGALREVLKHPAVTHVTLVDLDSEVVRATQEHMPFLWEGSASDSRVKIIIDDGAHFIRGDQGEYDVIIVDSTDLESKASTLYRQPFYADCAKRLNEGGVFVNQNGIPALWPEHIKLTYKDRLTAFAFPTVYLTAVASYYGGHLAFGFASQTKDAWRLPIATIEQRCRAIGLKTRFYTPEMHLAAFALPPDISRKLTPDE